MLIAMLTWVASIFLKRLYLTVFVFPCYLPFHLLSRSVFGFWFHPLYATSLLASLPFSSCDFYLWHRGQLPFSHCSLPLAFRLRAGERSYGVHETQMIRYRRQDEGTSNSVAVRSLGRVTRPNFLLKSIFGRPAVLWILVPLATGQRPWDPEDPPPKVDIRHIKLSCKEIAGKSHATELSAEVDLREANHSVHSCSVRRSMKSIISTSHALFYGYLQSSVHSQASSHRPKWLFEVKATSIELLQPLFLASFVEVATRNEH